MHIPLVEGSVGVEVEQSVAGGSLTLITFPPGAAGCTVTDIGDIVGHELFPRAKEKNNFRHLEGVAIMEPLNKIRPSITPVIGWS